jgi:hypothetical protein
LKFSPTVEDALRIMLGPATRGYFDAPKAFAQGFSDLKSHQLRTYSAMQKAVRIIAEDLDPAAIENATAKESGLAAPIGSRKARMWLSIEVPDNAGGQLQWLTLPVASPDTREVDYRATDVASRFTEGAETFMDSTADLRSEQEIDVAYPRRAFQLGRTAKPGYLCLAMARIVEIRDKVIIFDQKFAPPLLSTTTSMPMRGMKWPPHLPLAQTCATRTQHERLSSRSQ